MTKKRGLVYARYLYTDICKSCGQRGYYEMWKSPTRKRYKVISVRHVADKKTVKRCWLKNGTGGKQ